MSLPGRVSLLYLMASPSGTAKLCNLSTASNNGQSLPRIQAGSVHNYSMACGCILGNDCTQFVEYVVVYVFVCVRMHVGGWVGVCVSVQPVHVFTSHWAHVSKQLVLVYSVFYCWSSLQLKLPLCPLHKLPLSPVHPQGL